jgi:hypothetical protein
MDKEFIKERVLFSLLVTGRLPILQIQTPKFLKNSALLAPLKKMDSSLMNMMSGCIQQKNSGVLQAA